MLKTKSTAAIESADQLAVQAQAALASAEQHLATSDAAARMGLEDCRRFGAALYAKREHTPSDKLFGQWIRKHKLDTGLAANVGFRTDSMWLALHWERVTSLASEVEGISRPTHLRQLLRTRGFEWAKAQAPLERIKPGSWDSLKAKSRKPRAKEPEFRPALSEEQQRAMNEVQFRARKAYDHAAALSWIGRLVESRLNELRQDLKQALAMVEALMPPGSMAQDDSPADEAANDPSAPNPFAGGFHNALAKK